MGTIIAVGAAILLLLVAAYLAWTRRLERVRNAEMQVKLILAQSELVARKVQAEHLMGRKVDVPPPRKPKRPRPDYLKPLAVVGGGVATAVGWLRNHAAVTASLATAGAVLMLTPSVGPPAQSPPSIAEPNQGSVPPTWQEFPQGGPTTSVPDPPDARDPDAPDPPEVPATTTAPETSTTSTPEETSPPAEPTEQPSPEPPGQTPEQQPREGPREEPPEEPRPPCIEVAVPPEVNPGSCLDIVL